MSFQPLFQVVMLSTIREESLTFFVSFLDLVPDALKKLKTLNALVIMNTPIKNLQKQLTSLTNLRRIQLWNCSLTYLPDLTNLRALAALEVDNNQISHIGALPALALLSLDHNRLTEIPTLENPELLQILTVGHNPLKNTEPIPLYKNLEVLSLASTNLTSIPREIDQLQKLEYLDVSSNQLTVLPAGIFDLPQLQSLNLTDNLFSPDDIKSIQETLKTARPHVELIV